MINLSRLRHSTASIKKFTCEGFGGKKIVYGDIIDTSAPFYGENRRVYRISYQETLIPHTNCYSYAMGWRSTGTRGKDYNPGFITGQKCTGIDDLEQLVKSDLEAVGRKSIETLRSIPQHLPKPQEGYWIKALYCKKKGPKSIHFMVKDNKSGRWLHKVGWENPPTLVTKLVGYTTDRDLLLASDVLKEYSKEEVEAALHMFFADGGSGGIIPIKTIIEETDNDIYLYVSRNNLLYTYYPIWAMRIL